MILLFNNMKYEKLDNSQRKVFVLKHTRIAKEYNIQIPSQNECDYYYTKKIDEKSILVAGLGANVRGNMQYILNELNNNDNYNEFKVYVRTNAETDAIVNEYIKKNNWNRTKTVPSGYGKIYETCKYIITESYLPYNWVKRPEQVYMDLWHGTPLKKIGIIKSGKKSHRNYNQQKNFLNTNYMLYPNTFTGDTIVNSFKIASLMNGKALNCGYPRNVGLLSISNQEKEDIRLQLAPAGEKIFAYMPTFRGYLDNDANIKLERDFLDYLDRNMPEGYLVYVNLHHHVSDSIEYDKYKHINKFPPLIDSYALMSITDGLISDYSSVFFDYLILRKQIILHIEDLDQYKKHQGLNLNIEDFPFDKANSPKEVIDAMIRGKKYDDSHIWEELCAYDSIDNSKKVCRLLLGDESNLSFSEYPDNSKEKVLIYSYDCHPGETTDSLEKFIYSYDKSKYEVFMSCDSNEIDKKDNLDRAYPMLHSVATIGSDFKGMHVSSAGTITTELWNQEKISFSEAMDVLQFDYALMFNRMYGNAKFDFLIVYDVTVPEIIAGFAMADCDKKVLFLQFEVLEKVLAGDRFLKCTLRYYAKYYNAIAVSNIKYINLASIVLGDSWRNEIQVVSDISDIFL